MNRYDLRKKVRVCAGELIAEKGYVSPVDLLVKMERLTPQQVEDWRFRRIPYLERVAIGNLSKMNTILLALREFARSAGLKPSLTAYLSWGKGPKQRLRFSKYGSPAVEEKYSTHYVANRDASGRNSRVFLTLESDSPNKQLNRADLFYGRENVRIIVVDLFIQEENMEYRTLGKTGLNVSVVGFGGIPVQRVSAVEAAAIVNRALDLGINFFDTARGYTDSEEKLGTALKARRSQAVIATKSMARTREAMAADIRKSLNTMGLEYIDLYQLHNVKNRKELDRILGPDGALAALLEAKKEGLVRHIGITGHLKDFLAESLQLEEIETVQFPFNAVETVGVPALLERAAKKGTGVIVMKPLAGGALTNSNLALRYILAHTVTTVIPGMDSLEQVEANAAVGSAPCPSPWKRKKRWMRKPVPSAGNSAGAVNTASPAAGGLISRRYFCWTGITPGTTCRIGPGTATRA